MFPIEIKGLTKIYKKRFTQKVTALNNLDLTVNKGEIFGFLGPNGAGKSTTIKLILDIIKPTCGSISILGRSSKEPASRSSVGYLPENPFFYDYLTAKELLFYSAKFHNVVLDKRTLLKNIDELLERLDLIHVKNTPLRKYSKGMVQRAGIGQAIISSPDILILDEPASGLDPVGRKLVSDILLELKEAGKTVFFSSHILHDVETICDGVGIIINGELKYNGKVSEIISKSYNDFNLICRGIDETLFKKMDENNIKYYKEGETFKIIIHKKHIWEVTDLIRSVGGILLSLQPKRKSLEDIFFDFLKKSPKQEKA